MPGSTNKLAIWLLLASILLLSRLDAPQSCAQDGPSNREQLANVTKPPQLVDSSQALKSDQIDALIQSQQFDDALNLCEELFNESNGEVIQAGPPQLAGTQVVQRYFPLKQWCAGKLREILKLDDQMRQDYVRRIQPVVSAAVQQIQDQKNPLEALKLSEQYPFSVAGLKLQRVAIELHLEQGWTLAAAQIIAGIDPLLRMPISPSEKHSTLNWGLSTSLSQKNGLEDDVASRWQTQQSKSTLTAEEISQLLNYLSIAKRMTPNTLDEYETTAISELTGQKLQQEPDITLNDDFRSVATFAGSSQRNRSPPSQIEAIDDWPNWQTQLESYTANFDLIPASEPRVGERAKGTLPYFPVIAQGKVFLNELTTIRAIELKSGRDWPDLRPPMPLFNSQINPAAFVPIGYPLVGTPRGTLSLSQDGNALYARMGSPVTGWVNRQKTDDGKSVSYLIGLDLTKQGALIAGFPLRLSEQDFQHAEFDGCPLVWGDLLIAPIVSRDNVGLARSLAAFDRFDGGLRWKSPALSTGTVTGSERANLISHQLVTEAGGRLFYSSNLGSVSCVNPLDGSIVWTTHYRRTESDQVTKVDAFRFRYRDLTPPAVANGLVYCMPQDCPEVFALDAITGDLVWSTDDFAASDAIHMLGIHKNRLVVSGDRLVWLDASTGETVGRFPASATPGTLNGLTSPRGLGRGAISSTHVYWPTSEEIYVFPISWDGDDMVDSPPIFRRLQTGIRGGEGGNILLHENWLLLCTPTRLMAFTGS